MPLMPASELTKGSSVQGAFKAFPGRIFSEWLRFRRRSLSCLAPGWETAPKSAERVRALDKAATVWAKFN
jgi:hypothetical protein